MCLQMNSFHELPDENTALSIHSILLRLSKGEPAEPRGTKKSHLQKSPASTWVSY